MAEFQLENGTLKPGDAIMVTGPTTGVIESIVDEIHTDTGPAHIAERGDRCSIKLNCPIRKNDKLYKMIPVEA